MSNRTLRFEILQGNEVVRTEDLDQDVIKVGKLSSSHLRLDDPNVSRIHAVVERASDDTFSVIDLGSATGTYVNDEKVTKTSIQSGDLLRFGDTTIRVSMVDASAAPVVDPFAVAASTAVASDAPSAVVTAEDGSAVEPFTMQGYYDDAGNYIPGYYDELGAYHLGYGFYDDAGAWQVSSGYYNPEGDWIATDSPVSSVAPLDSDAESNWIFKGTRDTDVYQEAFFSDRGGDTLEVAMLWEDHVLSVVSYSTPRSVVIGAFIPAARSREKANDFVIEDPSIPDDRFPLVSYSGGGYTLNFTEQMDGMVREGDEEFTLAEAIQRGVARRSAENASAYAITLNSRTRVRLDIGPTTFLVHFTDVPAVILGGRGFDTAPLPYLGLSALAHILFVVLAMTMPDNARRLSLDGFQATDRFVQLMLEPDQEVIEKPDWLDDQGDEEAAAKHKGEEGKAGKEDAPDVNKKLAIQGDRDPQDLELKKARDTEIAMNAGLSQLMVASPWGTADTSVGSDAIHALGNLDGGEFGESRGFGGLGLHGAGRGGGGISERGLGLANVGTAGRGGGGRGGSGYGKGAGDLGERNSRVPNIVPGNPEVQGSLDKEIIRRVVRQHRGEIRYCYEQELQKNRGLAGRVTVRFTISATGSVVSAVVRDSTLNNAAVERCMTERIRRWVFPEPKGGGVVIVNYPFNLSS